MTPIIKKPIAGLLVVAIILPSLFLAIPQKADAYVWTSQVALGISVTDKEVVIGWDTLAWAAAKIALGLMSQLIIEWVRTGNASFSDVFYGGAQAWIKNFEVYLKDAADHAAGIFLEELLGPEVMDLVCSPFKILLADFFRLRIGVKLPPYPHARCTLSQIVANIQDFHVDFYKGGTDAYINMWLDPSNNPLGSIFTEQQRYDMAIMRSVAGASIESQSNQGFIGIKKCVRHTTGAGGQSVCSQYKTITPGKAVQDQLAESLRSELKGFQHADEISEIVAQFVVALVSALIQRGLE